MPTRREPHEPPTYLRADGERLWRAVCSEQDLDAHQLATLEAACVMLDRAHQARRRLQNDGTFTEDRYGGAKAHPAVDMERKAWGEFRLLVRELGLQAAKQGEGEEDPLDALIHTDGRMKVVS